MRLALSAEQEQLAAVLHAMLAEADIPAVARRWATDDHAPGRTVWRRLADLGVTGLAVPARWGGLAAHPADVVVACEELGHHALPGPVAESVAAVPVLLTTLGDEALCESWLPRLAAGEVVGTLAVAPHLPYATDADVATLVLRADARTLRLGVPGVRLRSVDDTRRLVEVADGALLAAGPAVTQAVARALDAGALACAAQLLGAGHALLETTTRYAGERTQFGRPIGQFQAVKHMLADVAVGLQFARPLLYAAAVAVADDTPTAVRDVSAARVACADAALRAARTALQVHGAFGYARESGLDSWLTRIWALARSWGTQSWHRGRIMAALTADDLA
ncbi:acyl-CoA dehydrogenase family protein [Micromonospora sp. WMMA1363]|uniref:acyl-CoA dehydrogenase family protein n=1 Tax=Micromonospora sp. WMMA1363 TaxID=3053985 RepID=UPI00259C9D99|nr:acyl-CoA dehydrogenase family protein [Micromonospora sp. WMMA1363]MDM4719411.1 acyl-CoA dehydrogenase family protein [Micromonospora sp. WMMA1363]